MGLEKFGLKEFCKSLPQQVLVEGGASGAVVTPGNSLFVRGWIGYAPFRGRDLQNSYSPHSHTLQRVRNAD